MLLLMADPRLVVQGEETAARVLEIIRASIDSRGIPPTMREIATQAGLSAMGARSALQRLESAGLIRLLPGVSRGIVLPRER